MLLPALDRPKTLWVDAAPFRAHLRHVCDATGLPWPVLAMRAGVSLALADHLLHGRGGRRIRRITRDAAQRLLSLSPDAEARLGFEWVSSSLSGRLVTAFVRRGWSAPAIADAAGVDLRVVRALMGERPTFVTRLDELRLLVLAAVVDRDASSRLAA